MLFVRRILHLRLESEENSVRCGHVSKRPVLSIILFERANLNLGLRLTNFLLYFKHCKSTLKLILFASDRQNVMVCQKVTFVVKLLLS
jgi:hypothetical protein